LCEALVISNRKLGTRLLDHCEVRNVQVDSGEVRGVETSKGFVGASAVVIAAGAWSSAVDPAATLQVEPVRGQMLCFRPEPQLTRHVIYSSRGYLIPRRNGRLLAGSTSECVGFDKRVNAEGREAISSMAAEIAPSVATLCPTDSWAGFRPRASDDLPVLGMSDAIAGLCYATGHYRNGILLAPITGELVAEAIISGAASALIAPFLPNRSDVPGSARQATRECFDTTEHVA
jgi:glycine oxidase